MAATTKTTRSAIPKWKFPESFDIIDQDVHQPEFIGKSSQNVHSSRVKGCEE